MPTTDLPPDPPSSGIRVLVAEDDDRVRSLFAGLLREVAGVVSVIEAADGIEAVELGREHMPDVAVLDLNMPGLDGVAAALRLRGRYPAMRIALQSADPGLLRERASGLDLPLFDKLEFEALAEWVAHAADGGRDTAPNFGDAVLPQKMPRVCSHCGYGIMSRREPDRCPMCGGSAWADPSVRVRRASAYDRLVG